MLALTTFFIFIFGSAVGSFLNVVILRLPAGKKLNGRSHCQNCGHKLSAEDLIPLVSFLALRGKCRYCGHKISSRYFVIEAITGILFAGAYLSLAPQDLTGWLLLIKSFVVIGACVVAFAVDLEHLIILTDVVFFGGASLIILNSALDLMLNRKFDLYNSLLINGLLGSLLGALPIFLIWAGSKLKGGIAGKWMGFGDVLLMLMLGSAVGLNHVFVLLFLAIIMGGVVSVFLLSFGGRTLKTKIPFGVFLTTSTVVTMFYGQQMLGWYLAILGF